MNLFGGGSPKPQKAQPVPSIDEARQRVDSLRRGTRIRRRASGMLNFGNATRATPTAARQVTGN